MATVSVKASIISFIIIENAQAGESTQATVALFFNQDAVHQMHSFHPKSVLLAGTYRSAVYHYILDSAVFGGCWMQNMQWYHVIKMHTWQQGVFEQSQSVILSSQSHSML